MRKTNYILSLCLGTFLCLSGAFAQNSIHPSFSFEQIPQRILKPIVDAHPHLFKEPPTPDRMDKIIQALYGTGDFETLKISRLNGKTVISGTPLKTLASITVRGVKKLSESAVLGSFNIAEGEKFIFQNIYDGAERIKELYGKNGFFNTVVSIDTQPASNNRLHLQIIIEEGRPCLIKNISFITTYDDLSEKIRRQVKSYINKPLTDDTIIDLEGDVKDFFVDNKILSVSIQGPTIQYNKDKTESFISYTLENAYKYLIFYEGNKYFSAVELSNKLEVNSKVQFGSNPTAELAAKLEKIYHDYGFANVSIKYTENIQAKSYTRRAYFKINEGPRSYLKDIRINGKVSRPTKYYADLFKSFYNQNIYKQDQVKVAQDSVITELQNQGFLKAQFLSSQTTFSKDKRHAEVSLFIDEGPQTKINSIRFEGLKSFSKEQMKQLIGLKEDTPVNLHIAEASREKIINYYRNRGYLEMELKSSLAELIKYSEDNTKADIYYKIVEGPQIKVARIVVEGNALTKQYVILNELEFDIGDVLTPQKIVDSEYHLQKTTLFTQVSIDTLEKGTNSSERTVLIRVSERDPGLFNMGLGVNTEFDFTIRSYVGLSYNNIGGTARALTGRVELKRVADINFLDHSILLGYLEPVHFAKRTRGRVNLLRTRGLVSRSPDIEVLESTSLTLLLEKDFTRFFKGAWTVWSFAANKNFNLETDHVLERVNIAAIGPILEYDRRDHPFVTRKGYYTKLSAEYADGNLGSSNTVHYIKTVAQINTYVPTNFIGITWATSVAGGYLKNTEDQDNSHVPDSKIFKLGGRDTIRGYEPNEIGDKDINNNDVFVNKESHYYLIKSEFRIPIKGQLESVLFYDGGEVNVKGVTFRDPYRDSVGIGFRYQTPVGPLSFEYGYKLDRNRDLDDSPGRLHISFGTF